MPNPNLLINMAHIIIDGLFESVPILLSFMAISFGASEKEVGIIISVAIMGSTLLGLSTMFLSRFLGLLRTLGLVFLLYGFGFFTNAFSQNIYFTGCLFVIAIAGNSVFHNVAFANLASNAERHSMGKIMGNFTATGDIGRVPFASLAGFIVGVSAFGFSGWRITCLIYGLGAILFAGYVFFSSYTMKKKEYQGYLSTTGAWRNFPSFALLRNRQYALAVSATVLDGLGSDHIFTFLPYLLFAKDIDPKSIGTFALAFTAGCFLGKVLCGRMIDVFGARNVFIISEAVMVFLLVILVLGQQLFVIVGTSFFLGIVSKGTVPVVQTIITESVKEKHNYENTFAISSFCRGAASMITPLLFGCIASLYGISSIYGIMAVAVVCAIAPVFVMSIRSI